MPCYLNGGTKLYHISFKRRALLWQYNLYNFGHSPEDGGIHCVSLNLRGQPDLDTYLSVATSSDKNIVFLSENHSDTIVCFNKDHPNEQRDTTAQSDADIEKKSKVKPTYSLTQKVSLTKE